MMTATGVRLPGGCGIKDMCPGAPRAGHQDSAFEALRHASFLGAHSYLLRYR